MEHALSRQHHEWKGCSPSRDTLLFSPEQDNPSEPDLLLASFWMDANRPNGVWRKEKKVFLNVHQVFHFWECVKVVLHKSPRCQDNHDLSECHRLYDLGKQWGWLVIPTLRGHQGFWNTILVHQWQNPGGPLKFDSKKPSVRSMEDHLNITPYPARWRSHRIKTESFSFSWSPWFLGHKGIISHIYHIHQRRSINIGVWSVDGRILAEILIYMSYSNSLLQ